MQLLTPDIQVDQVPEAGCIASLKGFEMHIQKYGSVFSRQLKKTCFYVTASINAYSCRHYQNENTSRKSHASRDNWNMQQLSNTTKGYFKCTYCHGCVRLLHVTLFSKTFFTFSEHVKMYPVIRASTNKALFCTTWNFPKLRVRATYLSKQL